MSLGIWVCKSVPCLWFRQRLDMHHCKGYTISVLVVTLSQCKGANCKMELLI